MRGRRRGARRPRRASGRGTRGDVHPGEHGLGAVGVPGLRAHHPDPPPGSEFRRGEARGVGRGAPTGAHPPVVLGHRTGGVRRRSVRDRVVRGVLDAEGTDERPIVLAGGADRVRRHASTLPPVGQLLLERPPCPSEHPTDGRHRPTEDRRDLAVGQPVEVPELPAPTLQGGIDASTAPTASTSDDRSHTWVGVVSSDAGTESSSSSSGVGQRAGPGRTPDGARSSRASRRSRSGRRSCRGGSTRRGRSPAPRRRRPRGSAGRSSRRRARDGCGGAPSVRRSPGRRRGRA